MPAYLLVNTAIENAEEYEKYKALARPIAKKFGGVYRVRGGAQEIFRAHLGHEQLTAIADTLREVRYKEELTPYGHYSTRQERE